MTNITKSLAVAAMSISALVACDLDTSVDTAEISDSVVINYPASTIMCSDRNDAQKVYVTGKFALWEELRLTNNDVWKAVKAESEGRKLAMRTAYSCRWASSSVRFVVVQKNIVGTEKDMFHVIDYCLQPEGKNNCWWVTEDFGARSIFKDVQRKTRTEIADKRSGSKTASKQK
jgi:hypothetical protein